MFLFYALGLWDIEWGVCVQCRARLYLSICESARLWCSYIAQRDLCRWGTQRQAMRVTVGNVIWWNMGNYALALWLALVLLTGLLHMQVFVLQEWDQETMNCQQNLNDRRDRSVICLCVYSGSSLRRKHSLLMQSGKTTSWLMMETMMRMRCLCKTQTQMVLPAITNIQKASCYPDGYCHQQPWEEALFWD